MQPELHDGGESQKDSPSIVPVVKGQRWDDAVETYKLMDGTSITETLASPDPDTYPERRIWIGYIGELMKQLGGDRNKGTRVIRDLERMGCIEMRVRGKQGKPSEAVVIKPPTKEAFADIHDTLHLTSKSQEKAQVRQAEQSSLLERIQWLEETVTILAEEVNRHQSEDHAQKSKGTGI